MHNTTLTPRAYPIFQVSGSNDGTCRIWSIPDGAPVAVLTKHGGTISACQFAKRLHYPAGGSGGSGSDSSSSSAGAPILLSVAQDASILLWDGSNWKAPPIILRPTQPVNQPTGLGGGGGGGAAGAAGGGGGGSSSSLLNAADGGRLYPSASCSAISATGRFAAVGLSVPPYLLMWPIDDDDILPGKKLQSIQKNLPGHTDDVASMSFSHRGDCLLTGAQDGTARAWMWRGKLNSVQHIKLAASPEQIQTAHAPAMSQHFPANKPYSIWIDMVAWSCDDRYVFTSESLRKQTKEKQCVSSCVRVWALPPAAFHTRPNNNGEFVHELDDCQPTLLNTLQASDVLLQSKACFVLQPHPFEPTILASAGYDGWIRIWDAVDGTVLSEIRSTRFPHAFPFQEGESFLDGSWSADGTYFAAANLDAEMIICGLESNDTLTNAPPQQFYETDTRLIVHAQATFVGGAQSAAILDQQTGYPFESLATGPLCDLELNPLAADLQREEVYGNTRSTSARLGARPGTPAGARDRGA